MMMIMMTASIDVVVVENFSLSCNCLLSLAAAHVAGSITKDLEIVTAFIYKERKGLTESVVLGV